MARRRTSRSRSVATRPRLSPRLIAPAGLLIIAILFGGGGTPAPLLELVVELAAIAAVVGWIWTWHRGHAELSGAPDGWWIAAVFGAAILTAVQLIPLPPALWHMLPGRGVEVATLSLIGEQERWMPISVAPWRTFSALLSLVPPLAMAWMVARLNTADRSRIILLLAILGALSAVVCAIQLASGRANLFGFYGTPHIQYASGFQANRNAEADVLLITAIAAAASAALAVARTRRSAPVFFGAVAVVVLLISVVLTASRTGVTLITVALLFCGALVIRRAYLSSRRLIAALLLAVVGLGGTAYVLQSNDRIQRAFDRFDDLENMRPYIWRDTTFAIGNFWPVGSGVGTFTTVFPAAERLEYVRSKFANRAHNDYLEVLLEGGIVAVAFLLFAVGFGIKRLLGIIALPPNRERVIQLIFLTGAAAIIMLHSAVDYPLRSMSLACVMGVCAGLLAWSRSESEPRMRVRRKDD